MDPTLIIWLASLGAAIFFGGVGYNIGVAKGRAESASQLLTLRNTLDRAGLVPIEERRPQEGETASRSWTGEGIAPVAAQPPGVAMRWDEARQRQQ